MIARIGKVCKACADLQEVQELLMVVEGLLELMVLNLKKPFNVFIKNLLIDCRGEAVRALVGADIIRLIVVANYVSGAI